MIPRPPSRWPAGLLGGTLGLLTLTAAHAGDPLQFNRDIRPILSDRCFKCHGPDKGARKSNLRLDQAADAYAERKKPHTYAIVPGQPATEPGGRKDFFDDDDDDLMPPAKSNLTLTADEKEKIRRWIAEGAVYQPHWAFIPPPETVPVPVGA